VRAILDGRKTMTRRVMKPQLVKGTYTVNGETTHPDVLPLPNGKVVCPGGTPEQGYKSLADYCPYGKVGDRLWVRETFYVDHLACATRERLAEEPPEGNIKEFIYYRADGECCEQIPECQCGDVGKPKWAPPIHMPRWASRLTLEITGVRVQRLQSITEADAVKEGIAPYEEAIGNPEPQATFANLWDKINGKRHPWASNPWCWVIEFKVLCN